MNNLSLILLITGFICISLSITITVERTIIGKALLFTELILFGVAVAFLGAEI